MRPIQLVTLLTIIDNFDAFNLTWLTNENLTHLQSCINEIQYRHANPEDIIFFINLDPKYRYLKLHGPIVIQNELREVAQFQLMHVNFYIIVVPKGYFERIFNFLVLSTNWNPRAKFVLLLQEDLLKDFLVILQKYFVYNVLFLVEKTHSDVDIMTYYPFTLASNEFQILGGCHNGKLRDDRNLFPNKLLKNWKNYPVSIILFHFPPYIILENDQTQGIELSLFEIVSNGHDEVQVPKLSFVIGSASVAAEGGVRQQIVRRLGKKATK
ncbi:hypothetical protein RI129_010129 [Pyrocoelia pectoralis]|uniref:Uncharacterized protein n=1 Tax=Pyrocoelia pectoralis TaxID=417401 RepID=A0AAN7ZFI8_9COLE